MSENRAIKSKGLREPAPGRVKDDTPTRAASVPEGQRPVLIVEPEGQPIRPVRPRPDRRRRDPLQDPEVVAARARTETVKTLGHSLATLTGLTTDFLDRAQGTLQAAAEAETLADAHRRIEEARDLLGWLECANADLRWLAGKHEVGMMPIELPLLIRDAVKRAHQGSTGVGFRLPAISQSLQVTGHPQHLLDAFTLAVTLVLDRMKHAGTLEAVLVRGRYFVQVQIVGHPQAGGPAGALPKPEDPARLRHLVVGLHQGTLSSSTGDNGEVVITIGLPLRTFHAEAR